MPIPEPRIAMLFIHNDVVARLLTMRECIDAQEHAFRQIPTGGAIHRPRLDMYIPCEREDGYYRWGTMEGANDGIFAIRMKSDVMTWPVGKDGHWRQIPGARGFARRRHARFRRYGAHVPRSVRLRARHPRVPHLQPERCAARDIRRRDVAPA
jgi:hypothetical protein